MKPEHLMAGGALLLLGYAAHRRGWLLPTAHAAQAAAPAPLSGYAPAVGASGAEVPTPLTAAGTHGAQPYAPAPTTGAGAPTPAPVPVGAPGYVPGSTSDPSLNRPAAPAPLPTYVPPAAAGGAPAPATPPVLYVDIIAPALPAGASVQQRARAARF